MNFTTKVVFFFSGKEFVITLFCVYFSDIFGFCWILFYDLWNFLSVTESRIQLKKSQSTHKHTHTYEYSFWHRFCCCFDLYFVIFFVIIRPWVELCLFYFCYFRSFLSFLLLTLYSSLHHTKVSNKMEYNKKNEFRMKDALIKRKSRIHHEDTKTEIRKQKLRHFILTKNTI